MLSVPIRTITSTLQATSTVSSQHWRAHSLRKGNVPTTGGCCTTENLSPSFVSQQGWSTKHKGRKGRDPQWLANQMLECLLFLSLSSWQHHEASSLLLLYHHSNHCHVTHLGELLAPQHYQEWKLNGHCIAITIWRIPVSLFACCPSDPVRTPPSWLVHAGRNRL